MFSSHLNPHSAKIFQVCKTWIKIWKATSLASTFTNHRPLPHSLSHIYCVMGGSTVCSWIQVPWINEDATHHSIVPLPPVGTELKCTFLPSLYSATLFTLISDVCVRIYVFDVSTLFQHSHRSYAFALITEPWAFVKALLASNYSAHGRSRTILFFHLEIQSQSLRRLSIDIGSCNDWKPTETHWLFCKCSG